MNNNQSENTEDIKSKLIDVYIHKLRQDRQPPKWILCVFVVIGIFIVIYLCQDNAPSSRELDKLVYTLNSADIYGCDNATEAVQMIKRMVNKAKKGSTQADELATILKIAQKNYRYECGLAR